MVNELVRVTAIEPEQLILQSAQSAACTSCKVKTSCGQHLFNSGDSLKAIILPRRLFSETPDMQELEQGEKVQISIQAADLVKISSCLYLVPIAVMLLTALLGEIARLHEVFIIVASFGLLLISIKLTAVYLLDHTSLFSLGLQKIPGEKNVQ